MKILYDISKLGETFYQPVAKSGLSRVIENVAEGLVESPECDVQFCAIASLADASNCLDYLKNESRLKSAFLSTQATGFWNSLDTRRREIDAELADAYLSEAIRKRHSLGLTKRIERRVLSRLCKAINFSALDERWLDRVDIFHSPLYPLPAQIKNVQRFLTVYDIIPILHPQFCNPSQIQFTNNVLASIRSEDWIIGISQSTKTDLCNHISVDPARVFVTPLAAEPELFYPCDDLEKIAATKHSYDIPNGPYILSVNTLEPRKNLEHVIRCFAAAVQQENMNDLNLVLVGAKGWLYDEILETISVYSSLKERIIVTGYVVDEHLAPLYSGALAFVFPSFYEGFGLTALEAMQCGIPVITSNRSSLPEVVGDAGLMLEPDDTDGLCHAIVQVYRSASLRETMSMKSLERAKQFSWDRCVRQTIAAYQMALSS